MLVCSSPAYEDLLQQHKDAWQQLRTVKETLKIIQQSLKGQFPQSLADEIARIEPLELRIGYAVGPLVSDWATAMAQLVDDPNAELPA